MSGSNRKIVIDHHPKSGQFEVVQTTNTSVVLPGDMLKRADVDRYVRDNMYQVLIRKGNK